MFSNMNPLGTSTAIWEILLMLLGSFILGYLLCRCIAKCGGKSKSISDKGITATAGAATKFSSNDKDDLQIIEGVGPAIEKILNKNGIYTYKQVVRLSETEIRSILDAEGPQFKIRTGETWAEQAELARDGKWDQLEDLKDELIDGKRV
jgi:hypothetical protein